jgi:hypothetical protein
VAQAASDPWESHAIQHAAFDNEGKAARTSVLVSIPSSGATGANSIRGTGDRSLPQPRVW